MKPTAAEKTALAKKLSAPTMIKLSPSGDWIVTFWCDSCQEVHHMLAMKVRTRFKAYLCSNSKVHKRYVGMAYADIAGAPDDKLFDDIEAEFGPEEDDDEDEDSDSDADDDETPNEDPRP